MTRNRERDAECIQLGNGSMSGVLLDGPESQGLSLEMPRVDTTGRWWVRLCAVLLLPQRLEFSLGLLVLALVENHDDMVKVKRF